MQNLAKGMLIGGVFASQTLDKSGEIIDVEGLDISALNNGEAYLNSEHQNGSFSNYLGRIVNAKKIFKYEECENEHEKKCFKESGEVPIVYGVTELFDDEGHTEAACAASIIKHYAKRNLPIVPRFSIEGDTLDREGINIKRAVARRVALTMVPCNDTCVTDMFKSLTKSEQDVYQKLNGIADKNYLCKGTQGTVEILAKNYLKEKIDLLQKNCEILKNQCKELKKSTNSVIVNESVAIDVSENPIKEKVHNVDLNLRNKKAQLFAYQVLINTLGD